MGGGGAGRRRTAADPGGAGGGRRRVVGGSRMVAAAGGRDSRAAGHRRLPRPRPGRRADRLGARARPGNDRRAAVQRGAGDGWHRLRGRTGAGARAAPAGSRRRPGDRGSRRACRLPPGHPLAVELLRRRALPRRPHPQAAGARPAVAGRRLDLPERPSPRRLRLPAAARRPGRRHRSRARRSHARLPEPQPGIRDAAAGRPVRDRPRDRRHRGRPVGDGAGGVRRRPGGTEPGHAPVAGPVRPLPAHPDRPAGGGGGTARAGRPVAGGGAGGCRRLRGVHPPDLCRHAAGDAGRDHGAHASRMAVTGGLDSGQRRHPGLDLVGGAARRPGRQTGLGPVAGGDAGGLRVRGRPCDRVHGRRRRPGAAAVSARGAGAAGAPALARPPLRPGRDGNDRATAGGRAPRPGGGGHRHHRRRADAPAAGGDPLGVQPGDGAGPRGRQRPSTRDRGGGRGGRAGGARAGRRRSRVAAARLVVAAGDPDRSGRGGDRHPLPRSRPARRRCGAASGARRHARPDAAGAGRSGGAAGRDACRRRSPRRLRPAVPSGAAGHHPAAADGARRRPPAGRPGLA